MTWRDYVCESGKRGHKRRAGNLFDALVEFSTDGARKCDKCGHATELRLQFDFGLDIGRTPCTVLNVFMPRKLVRWNKVVFYPFLVVVQRGKTLAYWLPYWHLDDGKKKYGQWAAFMNEPLFKDLLLQAKKHGYLRNL